MCSTGVVWVPSARVEGVGPSQYLPCAQAAVSEPGLHLVFFNEPEQKQRETAGTRSALCFSSIFIFCHQYSYNNVKPLAQARHSACHQYSHLLIVIHITLNCWHQVSDLFVINIHITASS